MKRTSFVVIAFLALACNCVNAQVMDTDLINKGTKLYIGDTKLSKADIANLDEFDIKLYDRGRAKFTSGLVLVSVGAIPTVLAVHDNIALKKANKNRNPEIPNGPYGAIICVCHELSALILEGIGIPLTCVGLWNVHTAVGKYNNSHPSQLSLQPSVEYHDMCNMTQPSVGLSLYLNF